MKLKNKTINNNKILYIGLFTLLGIIILAIFGPLIFSGDPNKINFVANPLQPSWQHWLGTDDLGRDILLRIIYGSRISLLVALTSVSISITIGTIIGAIAGFYRGFVDEFIMRLLDMLMAIPTIFLLLTIQVLLKPSIVNVIIVIGLTSWMGVARIMRGEFLALSQREFVLSSQSRGFSNFKVIFKDILPNALGPLFAIAILSMGGAILTESALSFFGLGVQPPHASWGNMLYNAQEYMTEAWWMTLFPGMFILITVLCLNLVGDRLNEIVEKN